MSSCSACHTDFGDSWDALPCLVCGAVLCGDCLNAHQCQPIPPLWENQKRALDGLRRAVAEGHRCLVLQAPCAAGKCLGRDTPILMADGSIKMVQDVTASEKVMGPDSKPRNVTATSSGFGRLWRVIPRKGDPYIVNENHILSLKFIPGSRRNKRDWKPLSVVNIGVEDYAKSSITFRASTQGWRSPVDFPENPVPISPYLLGVWLGDGDSRDTIITTGDIEIEKYIKSYCDRSNLRSVDSCVRPGCKKVSICGIGWRRNWLRSTMRMMGLLGNKHVPLLYKANSRRVRLEVLAGLIDTDGYASHSCYDLVFKSSTLTQDAAFLARSLGMAAYIKKCRKVCCNNGKVGEYYRVCIGGPVHEIPVRLPRRKIAKIDKKKNPLVVGIRVEPIGKGEYFGFEVDGDHLFLLGDFTVTHNSRIMAEVASGAAAKGKDAMIVASRRILIGDRGIAKSVAAIRQEHTTLANGYRSNPGQRVSIASLQTLHARVCRSKRWEWPKEDVVLPDEFHETANGDMLKRLVGHYLDHGAVVILTSATPVGADKLGATAVVCGGTKKELMAAGKIVPCVVYSPEEPDLKGVKRNAVGEYTVNDQTKVFWQYVVHGDIVGHWRSIQEKYAFGGYTIVWAPGVRESLFVRKIFTDAGVTCEHIDGDTPDAERERIFEDFRAGRVSVLTSCNVLGCGVDLPEARHGILLQVCAAYSNCQQKVGRLMRSSPGKTLCVLQDHAASWWRHGDPNEDRVWKLGDNDRKIAKEWQERFELDKDGREPTRCPECGCVRYTNLAQPCPACGWSYVKSVRLIRCTDGTLVRKVGNVFKKKKTYSQEESVWRSCLYACAGKGMTLRQAAGWYQRRTGRWPEGDYKSCKLPERDSIDWNRRVGDVYPFLKRRKKKVSAD